MLCEQAGAAAKEVPLYKHIGDLAGNAQFVLPMPCFNVINGGVHSGNYLAPQGRQLLFLVLRKHRLSASCLHVNYLFLLYESWCVISDFCNNSAMALQNL